MLARHHKEETPEWRTVLIESGYDRIRSAEEKGDPLIEKLRTHAGGRALRIARYDGRSAVSPTRRCRSAWKTVAGQRPHSARSSTPNHAETHSIARSRLSSIVKLTPMTSTDGCFMSGTATTCIPARCAASTPFSLSSNAKQSLGDFRRRETASSYTAGSGLPRATSSPPAIALKKSSTPTRASRDLTSCPLDDDATAHGIPALTNAVNRPCTPSFSGNTGGDVGECNCCRTRVSVPERPALLRTSWLTSRGTQVATAR